ncbi:MAG: hypothetical protein MJE63_18710 [Proteobacteria bacterium]|nr:hypothetical protein [Pseudomonadota bacterium]
MAQSLIKPEHFTLPKLNENIFLFFIQHHLYLFHELVEGGKIKSYGPAKRFDFTCQGKDCTALGGFIGAPLAVIILENAIHSGGKYIKGFGTAGCVGSHSIDIGEVHRPAEAVDETGMIRDYGGDETITQLNYQNHQPSCRRIVTVNSFYRLTEVKLEQYKTQNIDLIDMEAAPLDFVSRSKGVRYDPLFVVSDKINPDHTWQYENKSAKFMAGIEMGLKQLLD